MIIYGKKISLFSLIKILLDVVSQVFPICELIDEDRLWWKN